MYAMMGMLGVILVTCLIVVAAADAHVEYKRTGSCSVSAASYVYTGSYNHATMFILCHSYLAI